MYIMFFVFLLHLVLNLCLLHYFCVICVTMIMFFIYVHDYVKLLYISFYLNL